MSELKSPGSKIKFYDETATVISSQEVREGEETLRFYLAMRKTVPSYVALVQDEDGMVLDSSLYSTITPAAERYSELSGEDY